MAEVLATVTGMGRGVAALPSISMAAATGGLTPEQIIAVDGAHLWHPYSSIGREAVSPVVAVAAHGAWLTLIRDGQPIEVLDAMSSWWTAIHGHGHPALDQALTTQLRVMNHVMFGGLTHEPAARLAKLLVDITPAGLDTVFFSDSGSVSVEVAAKMALHATTTWSARCSATPSAVPTRPAEMIPTLSLAGRKPSNRSIADGLTGFLVRSSPMPGYRTVTKTVVDLHVKTHPGHC